MAQKPEIQYIRMDYNYGSEARAVAAAPAHAPRRAKTTLPKAAPKKEIRLQVDPVALFSLVVAAVMLVLMGVGMIQYSAAYDEHEAVAQYVTELRDENVLREHAYRSGYDLAEIEAQAIALGMVPVSEAETITITVDIPQPEPEPTAWENLLWFLDGLLE